MKTLLLGFIALVLVPALILSWVLARITNRRNSSFLREDCSGFTISDENNIELKDCV